MPQIERAKPAACRTLSGSLSTTTLRPKVATVLNCETTWYESGERSDSTEKPVVLSRTAATLEAHT